MARVVCLFLLFVALSLAVEVTVFGSDQNEWFESLSGSNDFVIREGDIVAFEWDGINFHNIVVEAKPKSGSSWTGTGGVAVTGQPSGIYVYENFTQGVVDYYCEPHRAFGMTGRISVCNSEGTGCGGSGSSGSVLFPSCFLVFLAFLRMFFE
mmetsp:Transcript_35824/g.49063  ORF Transcript_35824/g.49063 Transcript_35824/m.49063 type:complete len:152 (+) Transcript_35824:102-557(+)